jgi:hypothetical protein
MMMCHMLADHAGLHCLSAFRPPGSSPAFVPPAGTHQCLHCLSAFRPLGSGGAAGEPYDSGTGVSIAFRRFVPPALRPVNRLADQVARAMQVMTAEMAHFGSPRALHQNAHNLRSALTPGEYKQVGSPRNASAHRSSGFPACNARVSDSVQVFGFPVPFGGSALRLAAAHAAAYAAVTNAFRRFGAPTL